MSGFPSLPPPSYNTTQNRDSTLLNVQVLEAKEKEYKQWVKESHAACRQDGLLLWLLQVSSLQDCPYHSAAGVKPSDCDETELDMEEEEESLEESSVEDLNGDNGTSMFEESINAYVEDSDASVQDNSPTNDA